MSVGKEYHARERLVHHSAVKCHHDCSCGSSAGIEAARESCPGSAASPFGWDFRQRPGGGSTCHVSPKEAAFYAEDTRSHHERSAECRCRWPRPVPSSPVDPAGSPGHGPGRPARPAGAEWCGAPGRGAPAARRPRLLRSPPAALRHLVLLLLLLFSSVLRIAEGCSSRANPKPRGPSPSTRPPHTFNTEPCPEMYEELYCLNGAKCFKVNIGHNPLYNCECADGFMGQRCQFKDPDGSYSRSRDAIVEQASIAGGAGVALLVCLLLSGLLYVWSKRRRKSAAAASSSGQGTPRFGLRQHVVQMEPPPPAGSANQQPDAADVIELQPADRWTPPGQPPPPAGQTAPQDVPPVGPAAGRATAESEVSRQPETAECETSRQPQSETSRQPQTAPTEPQSRHCDRPP